ncbi:MAG: hypothetical protein KAH25_04040 [Bacteroidales bacterium]|nr:hypothetical protein [Bacteroidales bacterium]
MKKSEVPQDDANMLDGKFREPCYALGDDGKYTTVKSVGWEPKNIVMQDAWDAVNDNIAHVKAQVEAGELSPVAYYMEKQLMDVSVLAAYTGFYRWTVKRHLKMKVFKGLNDKKLQKYADVFEINIDVLKNIELL